jgi:hypothetical protein
MVKRGAGGRVRGRRIEAETTTLREKLERALRPRVEGALTRLRSTKNAVTGAAGDVRERLTGAGGVTEDLQVSLGKVAGAKAVASDIAEYAFDRITGRFQPSRHFDRLLQRLLLDASGHLIEAKKDVAVAIANHKRMVKTAEQEAANAGEWERRALLADKAGDATLARDARDRVRTHREMAEQLAADALELGRHVDTLKRELRTFHTVLEEAKVAQERMRAAEVTREARASTEREVRRVRELVGALAAITALQRHAGETGKDP